MPDQSVPVQFFAGSPRLHQLIALLVVFEKPGDSAPGKQVLRCRELIFRCAAVLASPSDDADSVMVVLPRSFSLVQTLADMRARVLGERSASRTDFACCLRYTLRAKLAPQWNVAGDLLLQGRDFLQVTGPVNGVRLQVTVTDEDMCLSTQACVVRLPRLPLSDLGAAPGALADFQASLCDVISERQMTGRWCHILPRMTKGQVATVTRHLLPSGPFASYKDLKRHWKNMYGYRLPEEPPSHYINVNFRLVGPQLFTYPPLCLRNGPVVFLARPAPRPILTALLRDLHVKVGSVCGQPLVFSGTPSYLTTQLQPAPQLQADVRPNVSGVPAARQPPPATRHVSQTPTGEPGAGVRCGAMAQPPRQTQQNQQNQPQQRGKQQQQRQQEFEAANRPGLINPTPRPPPPPKVAPQATAIPTGASQTPAPSVPHTGPRPHPPTGRPAAVNAAHSPAAGRASANNPAASVPPAAAPVPPHSGGGLNYQLGPLPRSPTPGQLPGCSSAPSCPSATPGGAAAVTPASPRPARIVPVFKQRPAPAGRMGGAGRVAAASPRPVGVAGAVTGTGVGRKVPSRPPAVAGAAAARRPPGTDKKQAVTAGRWKSSQDRSAGDKRQDIPSLCRRGQLHRASVATLTEWLRQRGHGKGGARLGKTQLVAQVQECLRGEVATPDGLAD